MGVPQAPRGGRDRRAGRQPADVEGHPLFRQRLLVRDQVERRTQREYSHSGEAPVRDDDGSIDILHVFARTRSQPYVYYYRSLFTKLKRGGRIELFKTRRDQSDDEVTLESICDKLIIWGTPESVADQLLAFQDEVGQFGTLLYAGKDWKDRELARQSMVLMAEKVMPRINGGTSNRSSAAARRLATRGPACVISAPFPRIRSLPARPAG